MTGREGNSQVCFQNLNVSHSSASGNIEIRGEQIDCFPRDQSLSDLLYSWKFWSSKFTKPRCNGAHRSTFAGNSALLHSDVIDFAMLPAQIFRRETVSLLDVMWPRSNQWERALLAKNSQLYNKTGCCMKRNISVVVMVVSGFPFQIRPLPLTPPLFFQVKKVNKPPFLISTSPLLP